MSGVWEDREYISRYTSATTGLTLHRDGVLTDSETPVTVDILQSETDTPVSVDRVTTTPATGLYDVLLTEADTSIPGPFDLRWNFTLGGQALTARTFIQVGEAAPAYDSLDANMKAIVESVWMRFADIYDSPYGGPHLQTYFQSHFGRNRIAQLLPIAVGLLNTIAQPYQTFTITPPSQFPVAQWGPLLEQALYVETLKHLIRSYTEQPEWVSMNLTHADRRDYMNRWAQLLQSEQETLKSQLDTFKISMMGLGRPHVLISGGVFGRYGPIRPVGSYATRPRLYARFY